MAPHPALDPVSRRLEPALLVGPGRAETPLDLLGGIVTATRQKVRPGEHGHVPGVGRHEPESGRLGGGLLEEDDRLGNPARQHQGLTKVAGHEQEEEGAKLERRQISMLRLSQEMAVGTSARIRYGRPAPE